MEKEIEVLREKMKILAEGCRNGSIDSSTCSPYIFDIVLAAAEVYKNTDIKLYAPLDNGEAMVCEESGKYFIPLYTCEESFCDEMNSYKEVTLKEVSSYAYDNQVNYDLLSNPDYCLDHGISYPELMEYAQNNLKYEGIILDPGMDDRFAFEGWLLPALVFKGMGVDKFNLIDAETGETEHEF